MPHTIIESDAFPATLVVPVAGEPASAPTLLSQFFQGVTNRTRWLLNHMFDGSGVFTPTADLEISTPTTKTITFNDVVIDSAADGSDIRSPGAIEALHRVLAASGTTGTVSIPYYYEHVFPGGFGYPVSGSPVWQVTDPPTGSTTKRWVMKLVNFQATPILVKNAAGTTLATILQDTGQIRACVIAWNGTAWDVIDYQWYH